MVRKSFLVAGLFLSALAAVVDTTASTAEACGGCRRGCGYGGCGSGCGYGGGCGYTASYYRGGCGSCGGCYAGCAPVYSAPCTTCYAPAYYAAPTCCVYMVPSTVYAPVYVNGGSRRTYLATSPILPVATYGMPVVVPSGTVATRSVLVGYSR